MSCGVGRRCGSDPMWRRLWRRPEAAGLIRPLAWKPPYAVGAVLKSKKKKKGKNKSKKPHKSPAANAYIETLPQGPTLPAGLSWRPLSGYVSSETAGAPEPSKRLGPQALQDFRRDEGKGLGGCVQKDLKAGLFLSLGTQPGSAHMLASPWLGAQP